MPRPVLRPASMAAADRRAIEAGTPESVLVERAGSAVARGVRAFLGGTYGRRVVVIAGKGNNGADARVATRLLRSWGVGVDLFALADGIDRDACTRALGRADAVVDGMFGTGFRGALEGDAEWIAGAVKGVPVVAIDIPSGVDGDTGEVRGAAVRATRTICFVALKPGLVFEPGRTQAGGVHVVDIGIDPGAPDATVFDVDDLALPQRAAASHKWSASVMVVGGSTGMVGAALMVSHAAARCGAGMVVCALPGSEAAARASGSEIVTRALPATDDGALAEDGARLALKDLARFDALAVGPGLGRDDRTQAAVRRLVAEAPGALVVDADGLNALATDPAPLRVRAAAQLPPPVLTPHAGEYERLAGHPVGGDRLQAAADLATQTGSIVLLKGPGTVVAAPDGRLAVNTNDRAALATAGSGDVLTGIIAGLLASGADPFAAAVTGAYVQGAAAGVAGTGDALVASDLLGALPRTLGQLHDAMHDAREDIDGSGS